MSILFYQEDVKKPAMNYPLVKRIIKEVISSYGYKTGNLSYIFCSDEFLLSMNREFLNHDFYTDVITFDYTENGILSGDVYISVDRVIENAGIYLENLESELVRVIVHGLLHLLGLKDKSPEEILIMRGKESELINKYIEQTKF